MGRLCRTRLRPGFGRRRLAVCGALGAVLAAVPAGPALALDLPTPSGQRALDRQLLLSVGARPDRVLSSVVPGPVVNDEAVLVGLSGAGAPRVVRLEQRLTLTGTGDYQVRERGPARSATPLGEGPPPVTKLGAVVWQGFSPGRRVLAARLTLDAGLEAARLPLFVTASQAGRPLGPGGAVPGAGPVTLRLENRTLQPATLPTATDAPEGPVAAALDRARAAALVAAGPRLPAAGAGLPTSVPSSGDAKVNSSVGVPLVISGTVRLPDATVSGPGVGAVPGGARIKGTLPAGSAVTFTVAAAGAGTLDFALTVTPRLDPRTLVPPGGAGSWAAWAAARPDAAARRAALDLLVQTTAIGARATSYAPYLGADLPGRGRTTFRYAFAPPERTLPAAVALAPRPGPIAAAAVAVLLLMVNGVALWRRA